MFTNTTEGTK